MQKARKAFSNQALRAFARVVVKKIRTLEKMFGTIVTGAHWISHWINWLNDIEMVEV
jgi:hypothetical protein